MAHDDNQDKDEKDKTLQKKLIEAYGSHSNVGMAKYHIRETAKLVLSGKEYNAIDSILSSGNKCTADISDKLHMSVSSLKRLYHSAVETLIDYQRQRKKRQEEELRQKFFKGWAKHDKKSFFRRKSIIPILLCFRHIFTTLLLLRRTDFSTLATVVTAQVINGRYHQLASVLVVFPRA